MYKLGIDLGGSKIEGVILDASHKQLFRERVPTEQEGGYRQILENLRTLYHNMRRHIADDPHTFGIGTPGAISPRTGLLRNSNTLCLNNMPLKADLENLLGHPIAMQNDANCFAMAEAIDGAGKENDLVFGVIMGTGCGGGIVYKQQIFTGTHAIAGEWGHTSIDPNGPECYCGGRGCVETFISGSGLEGHYQRAFGEKFSATEIVQRYRIGDANAIEIMQKFFHYFGQAMANLINVLDPDVVVLGGGLSNVDELYSTGAEEVRKRVFSDYCETPIVKNQLGDSAGVLGAALIGC